ncbi:alcohol dehydrogenase catalytic domain-containing protein [Yoonia sp.]|uniref:alcohol dehydrogenase catalytic domain-containing protein n=1 Tax=Yoonia sp. TaxID=2212373 RepID=UPI0035C7FC79
MTEKMNALVQLHEGYAGTQTGPDISDLSPFLAYRQVVIPAPAKGQALVKVDMAAVNPSDIHFIKGEYGQPRVLGSPAGFEGVGEVVSGDTPLVGQRVSFFASGSGAWAEYALADASNLVPCRPDLSDVDAAGQLVNPLTAIAMIDLVKDSGAESFILNAAGSQLGKLLIALGRDEGIKPIAVVRRSEQTAVLKTLGAAEVIVSTEPDAMALVRPMMKALKPRVLLDAVGDQFTADMFFAMPNNARWVNYGKLSADAPALGQLAQLIFQNKRIEGFWLSRWMKEVDPARIPQAFVTIQDRFVTQKWVTDVAGIVPLSKAMDALAGVLAKPDGKAFIDPRQ